MKQNFLIDCFIFMHQNLHHMQIDAWGHQENHELENKNDIVAKQIKQSSIKFRKTTHTSFHARQPISPQFQGKDIQNLRTYKKRSKSLNCDGPQLMLQNWQHKISSHKYSRLSEYQNINLAKKDSRVFTRPPIKTTYYSCIDKDFPKYKKPSLRQLLKNKASKTTYCNAHAQLQKTFHYPKNATTDIRTISHMSPNQEKSITKMKDKKKSRSYKLLSTDKNKIDLSLDYTNSQFQMQLKAPMNQKQPSLNQIKVFSRMGSPSKSGKFRKNVRKFTKKIKDNSNPILQIRGCKAN